MNCPKCGAANAEGVQFCTNCHATLIFKCPNCAHTQTHGGVCDACGENLDLFWASYLAIKTNEAERVAHDKTKAEIAVAAQALTAPFAGGASLSRFFIVQLLGRLFARFTSR
jgi:predicted amidophosphoribosyltransferase